MTEVDAVLRLDNQLCFPLYAASRLMIQAYRPHLDALGLTYPQYLVLLLLWERDGQTVSELGERLLLDSGTLTPVLKRMQRTGFVVRARRGSDERVVENRLTPSARRRLQAPRRQGAARAPLRRRLRHGGADAGARRGARPGEAAAARDDRRVARTSAATGLARGPQRLIVSHIFQITTTSFPAAVAFPLRLLLIFGLLTDSLSKKSVTRVPAEVDSSGDGGA